MSQIRIKLLTEATAPQRATDGSAGYDLFAYIGEPRTLLPYDIVKIRCGFHIELPLEMAMLICSRSGLASKGLIVINSPGIVDSDYRGEVAVLIKNTSLYTYVVQARERIAQALFINHASPAFVQADELTPTDRGEGGFGSTG